MYYYKIKGELRIRTCPDNQVKGDPYLSFEPSFYDYWSHKTSDGIIDKVWISEDWKKKYDLEN